VSVSGTASVPGFSLTQSATDKSTDLTYGIGARYFITRNFGARVEWQRYQKVGGDNTGTDDVDLFSVGALYAF
jgi:OOP family OmpA-OmpF porin